MMLAASVRIFIAVGTTVIRAIESSVSTEGFVKPVEGWATKFIFPPYEFSVANSMISNFPSVSSPPY